MINLMKCGSSFAAATVYGYLAVFPVALSFVLRYYNIDLQLMQILCIYGYSFFVYIPVSVSAFSRRRFWNSFIFSDFMCYSSKFVTMVANWCGMFYFYFIFGVQFLLCVEGSKWRSRRNWEESYERIFVIAGNGCVSCWICFHLSNLLF